MRVLPKEAGRRILRNLLPKTCTGDWMFALADFVVVHRRFPTSKMRFNDVLFRMKTSGELLRPERSFTSDKELVKHYVADRLCVEHVIPTIAVLRTREDVLAFEFPDNCAIKPTHLSGHVLIRKDGLMADKSGHAVAEDPNSPVGRGLILDWFDYNLYDWTREANYRYLTPKVIVEELAFGDLNAIEFKVFCYKGQARAIIAIADRVKGDLRVCNFTRDWDPLTHLESPDRTISHFDKPDCLDAILAGAEALARDFEFVRIDTFSDGTSFVVGEITHVHASARSTFYPAPHSEREFSELLFSEQ